MKNLIISLLLSLMFICGASGTDNRKAAEAEFKKGNYAKANKLLEIELRNRPSDINTRYLYAQSFIGLGNIQKGQKEYEKVIETAPDTKPAKLSLKALAKIYELQHPETVKEAEKQAKPSLGDSYISNATYNGKITRWSISRMPLKIYIKNAEDVPGYRPYYYYAALAAVAAWFKEAEPGTLSYAKAKNPQEADISVDFITNIGSQSGESYVAGIATPYIKGNILEKCVIKIRTTDIRNRYFSENDIFLTVLHEFGHALGIWGHSPQKTDVMYESESGETASFKSVSVRDINTLRLLYMLDPEISNFAPGEKSVSDSAKNRLVLGTKNKRTDDKLRECVDYVKNHPGNAISWTNLASAYSGAKNYTDAITCYKKALELDAYFVEARNGLAVAYDKTGDKENALNQFNILVSQEPKNIGFSYNLALCLIKSGNENEAYQVLKDLVSVNPEAAKDNNIKNLLQKLQ